MRTHRSAVNPKAKGLLMSAPSSLWIPTIPIRAQESRRRAMFAHSACKYLYISFLSHYHLHFITCIRKAGISARHTFFTGSVSTLCAYISRYVMVIPLLHAARLMLYSTVMKTTSRSTKIVARSREFLSIHLPFQNLSETQCPPILSLS